MSQTTLFDKNGLTLVAEPPNDSLQSVLILTMNRQENRFSEEMILTFNQVLDYLDSKEIVSNYKNPILIMTGSNKFFSNGLDLDAISKRGSLMNDVLKLLSRVLILGMPTIAAINGHGFGGGLFLALCCDWRLMRQDRGYLCFPEVDLKMPFSWGFANCLKDKVNNKNTIREASLTAFRYNASNALKSGLIDRVSDSLDQLVPDSIAFAHKTFKNKKFSKEKYSQMKFELYTNAYLGMKNFTANDSKRYQQLTTSKL